MKEKLSKQKPAFLGLLIGGFGTAVVYLVVSLIRLFEGGAFEGGYVFVSLFFLCIGLGLLAPLGALVGAWIGAMVEAVKRRIDD